LILKSQLYLLIPWFLTYIGARALSILFCVFFSNLMIMHIFISK
jgi:hypothetical protein